MIDRLRGNVYMKGDYKDWPIIPKIEDVEATVFLDMKKVCYFDKNILPSLYKDISDFEMPSYEELFADLHS